MLEQPGPDGWHYPAFEQLWPDEMHYNLAASPHACRLKTFNSIECPLMPTPNESEQGM